MLLLFLLLPPIILTLPSPSPSSSSYLYDIKLSFLRQKALSKFFLERLKEFPYLERDLSLNETGGSDFFEKFGSSYKHQVACPVCGKNFRNSNFLWIHATRKHWWEEGKKEEDGQEEEMGEGNEGGSILTEGGRKEGEGDEERRKEGGGEREKGGGEEGGGRGEQGGRRRRDEWVITLENFLEYENHRNYLNRKDYEINEGFYFRFKKCQKFIYNLLSEKESEDKLKKDKLWNKKEGGRIRDEFREEDKKDNAMGEWRDTEGHKLKEEGKEVRITEVGVGRKEEGERRERKKGDEGRENHIRRKEVYEFCESLYFDKKSRGRIKDFVEYSFGVMELGLMMIFGIGTIIFYSFACFLYMDMKEGLDEEERIERRRGWMKEGVDIMGEEEEDEDD